MGRNQAGLETEDRSRWPQEVSRIRRDGLIDDASRVCYLLLYLGVPWPERRRRVSKDIVSITSVHSHVEDARGWRMASAREAGRALGFTVWATPLLYRTGQGSPRYVFRFPRYARDDAKALRIAESVLCAVSMLHGPVLGSYDVRPVFRIPASLASNRQALRAEDLEQLEESRDFDDRITGAPWRTLSMATWISAGVVEAAWARTPVIFANDELYRAATFLKASQDDFWVAPGQIREAAADEEPLPRAAREQTSVENALQNAFKAIEAVLGDPPSDERRCFARLRAVGVDPGELVGYGSKRAVHEWIRAMSRARDKRAAHGSTGPRALSVAELLEFTSCAQFIVCSAVEAKMSGVAS